MTVEDQGDAQTRGVLLAAARELVGVNPNFSLKTLLNHTGVSRADFRRCFLDKEQLLTAVTGQEVRGLSEILEVAQPAAQSLRVAVGSDIGHVPAAAPAGDAWLERRLRVFERALAGLEKRQEKSEEALTRQLALMGEQLTGLAKPEPAPPAKPEAVVPAKPPAAVQARPAPSQPSVPDVEQIEFNLDDGIRSVAPKSIQAELQEAAAIAERAAAEMSPAEQFFADEKAAAPEPLGEKAMDDFIVHARRLARSSVRTDVLPRERSFNTRWLIGAGVALIVLLACAGALLASGALNGIAGAATARPGSGVIHRRAAQTGIARVMALSDNGNATAQTVLAMAYLKGQGVPDDVEAARRWSLAAATQGQPVAQYLLGTLYLEGDKNESEAVRWFRAAAGQGNIKAMHNLAIAYAQGLGVDEDPAQAVQWFMRAAQQGYRDSEFDLAVLYERGQGVPQNATAALKWYLIAAAHGDAPSATRAAFLKQQLNPQETRIASQEAASFVPQRAGKLANETPTL